MTIDERLEKLTERHEALTQTVELLTQDMVELRSLVFGGLTALKDSTQTLLKIAEDHQHRIERLEE